MKAMFIFLAGLLLMLVGWSLANGGKAGTKAVSNLGIGLLVVGFLAAVGSLIFATRQARKNGR